MPRRKSSGGGTPAAKPQPKPRKQKQRRLANVSTSAPVAVYPRLGGTARRTVTLGAKISGSGERATMVGREFLQTITTPSIAPTQGNSAFGLMLGSSLQLPGAGAGTNPTIPSLYDIQSSNLTTPIPQSGPFTRIGGLMRYWSRFRFRRARLVYEPRCTVTTAGSLAFRYFSDSADYLQAAATAWQRIGASAHGRQGNVYNRIAVDADFDQKEDLYVDISDRESASVSVAELRQLFQGVFLGVFSAGLPVNTALGDVYLEYEVVCHGEELPDLPLSTVVVTNEADQVTLISIAGTSTASGFKLDPGTSSQVRDRTTEIPSGQDPPPWWDPVLKGIVQDATYVLDVSTIVPPDVSGGPTQFQVNSSATPSSTLSGVTLANSSYPAVTSTVGGGSSSSNYTALQGLYKFVVTGATALAPYYLPQWVNSLFGTVSAAQQVAGAVQAAITQFTDLGAAESIPTLRLRSDPDQDLVSAWLRRFRPRLVVDGDETVFCDACNDMWGCLSVAPDGAWHGVMFPDLQPVLVADLMDDTPTAHLLFNDDDSTIVPSELRLRARKHQEKVVAALSAKAASPARSPLVQQDGGPSEPGHRLRVHETYMVPVSPRQGGAESRPFQR